MPPHSMAGLTVIGEDGCEALPLWYFPNPYPRAVIRRADELDASGLHGASNRNKRRRPTRRYAIVGLQPHHGLNAYARR
jgi:hypothetical protein